jgi:hypothetical protein
MNARGLKDDAPAMPQQGTSDGVMLAGASHQTPSPTQLLEMLSDRFGAFEAIANSTSNSRDRDAGPRANVALAADGAPLSLQCSR